MVTSVVAMATSMVTSVVAMVVLVVLLLRLTFVVEALLVVVSVLPLIVVVLSHTPCLLSSLWAQLAAVRESHSLAMVLKLQSAVGRIPVMQHPVTKWISSYQALVIMWCFTQLQLTINSECTQFWYCLQATNFSVYGASVIFGVKCHQLLALKNSIGRIKEETSKGSIPISREDHLEGSL